MKKASFDEKKVAKICNTLTRQGVIPTIKIVRERLGSGSPNLILQYMHQWEKEYELAHAIEDDLSPEFRQAALAECARKLINVRENLQKQIDTRDSQLNELQELLEDTEIKTENLSNELLEMKKEYEAKYLEYEAKLASLSEKNKVRLEQANEMNKKLDQEVKQLQQQIKQLQENKHQADIKVAAAEARNGELEKQLARMVR